MSLAEVEGRERDAGLDAPLHLEQLEMHVDGIGQIRLALFQRAKLDGFSRFRAAGARRASRSVGHACDHIKAR